MGVAIDIAFDLLKAPIVSDNRAIYDFDYIDREGEEYCCTQFRPALEGYDRKYGGSMFTGKSCSEMYDRLTELIDVMYSNPQKIPGNAEWRLLMPEIKRQWDECKAQNDGLEGME